MVRGGRRLCFTTTSARRPRDLSWPAQVPESFNKVRLRPRRGFPEVGGQGLAAAAASRVPGSSRGLRYGGLALFKGDPGIIIGEGLRV